MAEIRFAHIGMGDCVCVNHVIAIIQYGSATARRYQSNAKRVKKYIDATHGKTIKAFLILDDGTVIASHIKPLTLQQRFMFPPAFDTGVDKTPPATPYVESSYQDFLESLEDDDDADDEVNEDDDDIEALDAYEEDDDSDENLPE